MCSSDEAFDQLVEACPSFFAAHGLDRYAASFEDPDSPDLYVRLSAFAHHLVALVEEARLDEVRAVFAVADRLETAEDADTIELVELGLIESIQNIVSHEDVPVGPEHVRPLLGERLGSVWDDHDELWREAGLWRHDGPRVGLAEYEGIHDPNLRQYFQAHKRRLADGTLIGASDIVHYQTEMKKLRSGVGLAGVGRSLRWPALVIGVAVALALALALAR